MEHLDDSTIFLIVDSMGKSLNNILQTKIIQVRLTFCTKNQWFLIYYLLLYYAGFTLDLQNSNILFSEK